MSAVPRFSAREKQLAAEREVRWRQKVWPARVAAGRLSQAEFDRGIAIMEEIRDEYRELANAEDRWRK